MRLLQELGHKVILLIGGFTARLGDPTDETEARRLRSKEEVKEANRTYLDQVKNVLDLKNVEVRDNSEWYDQMKLDNFLRLLSKFNLARLLERDMFQARIKKNQSIAMHEIVYPVLQAYDSVELKADVALCGSDQKFNELQGRELQREMGQSPQDLLLVKILPGTDGKDKMSQSLGNDIPLRAEPKEQFAKIMSIPDKVIFDYFELLTNVSQEELLMFKKSIASGGNPKDIKLRLGFEVVKDIWGNEEAKKAEDYFIKTFSEKKILKEEVEKQRIRKRKYLAKDLLVELKLVDSKSQAQRLIEQGAVEIDGKLIDNPFLEIEPKTGEIVKVGKYKFKKIEL